MIEIASICKSFGTHLALDHVSLSIPKGAMYGILGHNGAGKTTLIRLLTQISIPDSGSIKIANHEIQTSHQSMIGYLPEERGLYKKMRVLEHLVYLGRLREMSQQTATQKAAFWLEKLVLGDRANDEIGSLSKGMQQKIQFAAAVLHDPEILILDEPFSGFDPVNYELFKALVLEQKNSGKTIIISSHRTEAIDQLCDYVAFIRQGKIVLNGSIEALKEQNKIHQWRIVMSVSLPKKLKDATIIRQQTLSDGKVEHYITLLPSVQINELIQQLLPLGSIHHISEQEPTMHEVFIKHMGPDVLSTKEPATV